MEFLSSIENSGFATWVRESPSLLAYTLFLALHTIGLAFLVGFTIAIALRLFGVGSRLPLAPFASFFPFMYVGFLVNLTTGLVLFSTAPINFLGNPVMYVKLGAVFASVFCLLKLKRLVFSDLAKADTRPVPANAKALAGASLLLWSVALLMGRLTAYSRPVVIASVIAFVVFAVLFLAVVFVTRLGSRSEMSGQRA